MTKEIDTLSSKLDKKTGEIFIKLGDLAGDVKEMSGYLRAKLPPNGETVASLNDIRDCEARHKKTSIIPQPDRERQSMIMTHGVPGSIGAAIVTLIYAILHYLPQMFQ